MEILKNLLSSTFGKSLRRLETRGIQQMNDLKFTKECFSRQEKIIERLASYKLEPRHISHPRRPEDTKTMKRDLSAKPLNRTRRIIEKKVVHRGVTPDSLPKTSRDKNLEKPRRNKTPDGHVPSYMQPTASKATKIKKEVNNIYHRLRMEKEKENAQVLKLSPSKAKERALTPDGRSIKKKKKIIKKKKENEENIVKKTIVPRKVVRKEHENVINNEETKSNEEMKIDTSISQIREFPECEDDSPKRTQVSNINDISQDNFDIKEIEVPPSPGKKVHENQKMEDPPIIEPPEKEDSYNSVSDILLSSKNKEIVLVISSFLPIKDQLAFYSTNKRYKPNIISVLEKLRTKFEELNDITSLSSVEDKINNIKSCHTAEELNSDKIPPLEFSGGTSKTLGLLNEEIYNNIFRRPELKPPQTEIIFVYRIFFQLIGKFEISGIESDKEFWTKCSEYILTNNNGKTGDMLAASVHLFNFSPENIMKIKRILNGKKDNIKPTFFSKICGTTGLFIFLIKDALEFCGIIYNEKKTNPIVMYRSLIYMEKFEKKISQYIELLKK